jgi:hypothetical protein
MGDLFYKEPTEKLDYSFEYELGTGETIASSVWTVAPVGLTLSNQVIVGNVTTVRIDGGTIDTDYTLTNTVTTGGTGAGRKDVQLATVRVSTEIISTTSILSSLPGGDGFDLQEAREIVEGALGRVKAAQGGTFTDEPFARSVVRKLARAEIWGDILRQSGHLSADETTKEEDKAEKLLKEYDAATVVESEVSQKVTSRLLSRG